MPALAPFCNRVLVRLWGIRHLALANFLLARPLHPRPRGHPQPRVSVIVPARNEAGNIPALFARTPEMGSGTELIFVEGHSSDDTYGAIERAMADTSAPIGAAASPDRAWQGRRRSSRLQRRHRRHPDDPGCRPDGAAGGSAAVLRRAAVGQGRVRQRRALDVSDGRAARCASPTWSATSSSAWRSAGCSASRSRTRCAAPRCLRREAYQALAANRAYFGDFDPFGDFDLLFGAAKLGLEIVDLPIRYRERTYGTTNIQRWRHGWLLLKMCVFAAGRIKFV